MHDSRLRWPKAARLRRPPEYAAVYESGRRVHGTFLVFTSRWVESPYARVGITVSKKVGNAVTRHRVQRRLRALSRAQYPDLPPGLEVVITARANAATADVAALAADFARCVRNTTQPVGR